MIYHQNINIEVTVNKIEVKIRVYNTQNNQWGEEKKLTLKGKTLTKGFPRRRR